MEMFHVIFRSHSPPRFVNIQHHKHCRGVKVSQNVQIFIVSFFISSKQTPKLDLIWLHKIPMLFIQNFSLTHKKNCKHSTKKNSFLIKMEIFHSFTFSRLELSLQLSTLHSGGIAKYKKNRALNLKNSFA